jgi:hypothetical protein
MAMSKFQLLILFLYILVGCSDLFAGSKPVASIPFEMVGSYVVVPVRINQSSSLRFILDSGVRNTIVTELLPGDSLSLSFQNSRDLQGLGRGNSLNAYVSDGNTLKLGRKLQFDNKTVYVLKEDVFNLSRQTGSKINGLIGSDFFDNYVVEIDYSSKRLRFYEPENMVVPKGYGVMPMTIEKQKMYIHLSVLETDSARRSIKMLIDTGAELSAWFQTLTNKAITIPEKSIHGRIGEGLSGEVTGIFARVPQICIANFCVKDPIVAFPDSAAISEIVRTSDREGTIGSQLLKRFNLIIDTFNKKFYFKPNSSFNKPFVYNIAGIEIAQTLAFFPQIEVINVWKGSPAERAGVKVGDVITEINFEKVFTMTLSDVRGYFEKSSVKPLKIVVRRGDATHDFEIDIKAKI